MPIGIITHCEYKWQDGDWTPESYSILHYSEHNVSGIEEVESDSYLATPARAPKRIQDGRIIIEHRGRQYSVMGNLL